MSDARVERIGVRELRQNASVYIDLVRTKGVTVEITYRGHLAARLVPAKEPESALEKLVAEGVLEPPESSGDLLDIVPDPLPPGATPPSEEILREREESRW